MVFIDIPSNRIQHELFIHFFCGAVVKAAEVFVFLDIPKMPFCLDGTDLPLQDAFLTLDIGLGCFF